MLTSLFVLAVMAPNDLKLWYRQPADTMLPTGNESGWLQALPIGNGRIGAMVFGGVDVERIQLNEDTIWSGPPNPVQPIDSAEHIQRARELLFAGRNAEAQDLLQKKVMAEHEGRRSYQPLGDLWIEMQYPNRKPEKPVPITIWKRQPAGSPGSTAENFDDSGWSEVKSQSDRQVPANSNLVFRGVFSVSEPKKHEKLQVSPIDDDSTIYLNGTAIGRTTAYNQSYTFDIKGKLKPGRNVIAIDVHNGGGAGHTAAEVSLVGNSIPKDYYRDLDLDSAIATTKYEVDGVKYTREAFVSPVDQVAVVFLTADKKGALNFDVKLDRFGRVKARTLDHDRLILEDQAGHDGKSLGTKFHGVVDVLPSGGSIASGGDVFEVRNANAAVLLVACSTDYNKVEPSKPLTHDRLAKCVETLTTAREKGYSKLKSGAVAEHQKLFRRVALDLGPTLNKPTDERLDSVKKGATDAGLEELYFQYGRYLLITSSRPGDMPANLQGVWSPYETAPWNADYHLNINLQMNYWIAEVGNLSECHLPMFDLMDNLRPAGRELAKRLGSQGIAAGHVTDGPMWAALSGQTVWGLWAHGLGWCSAHFMEHYRYTGDKTFLKGRAYPFLKEAAEFYLGWLVKDPATGKLVSGPSTSPENHYKLDGKLLNVAMGNAMDQEIIWEVFTNVLTASKELGITGEFQDRVKAALGNLAMPKIGADGRLVEWDRQYEEDEPGHRHLSHLYGVHPSNQFTFDGAPAYMTAAKKAMEHRLKNGGGHTGWSRAWIINFFARFLDAENAHDNVRLLLAKSTLINLFDDHPPFQIDGNFGGAAGIAEMLLQSHEDFIRLLPALPKAWPTGSFKGLVARGGFVIDVDWKDGEIKRAVIQSKLGGVCRIKTNASEARMQVEGSNSFERLSSGRQGFEFETKKGQKLTLSFHKE